MPSFTNSLVATTKKAAAPAAIAAALFLGAVSLFQHNPVQAAAIPAASGAMDDANVSSLTALDQAVEAVAARVTPAVVNVAVTSKGSPENDDQEDAQNSQQQAVPQLPPGFAQFFGPMMPGGNGQGGQFRMRPQQPQIEHGIGSGIIISPDGYIVTNNHVVEGATDIKVTLNDRRIMNAKLIGTDKLTDLAVIKVAATNLPSIPWGDSTRLKPGQSVLAFGSPFGYFQFSVTRGIVSAVNRPNPYSDDARKPGGFIQTDAAINPGNSGGALVDAHGELIGINTFIISNSGSFAGAGFAIPAQIAHAITAQIIKTGSVKHGYMGIGLNDVTPDNAQFFNLKDASGAIVSQVTPDSPAARAGLKQGDVIRQIDGQSVVNGSALQVAVSQQTPGTKISLDILRDGKSQTVFLTLGEYRKPGTQVADNDGAPADGTPKAGKLGLAVADLSPEVRHQLQLPEQVQGVAVENVRPASPADEAGLAPGDVIVEVNRKAVTSASQFVGDVHASPADKDMLLLVWSKGNATYRLLHPANRNG